MSDLLNQLHEKILHLHWVYLETEESIEKLDARRNLEGLLHEFLKVAPHDRKFFLPETADVLERSVLEMDDFTAQKALVSFEAISQYANNLYTKPWRKEYRIIKLYSGFYQHEVLANLVGADTLFEAMGYRRVDDDMFILEGPICPDQVLNVSRDAMTAYVECQIMKKIYTGVKTLDSAGTWQDVYNLRKSNIGGTTGAIRSFGYAIHERRLRNEKLVDIENNYTYKSSVPVQCHNCAVYSQPPPPPPPVATCAVHGPPVCSCGQAANQSNMISPYSVANYHQHQHNHHNQHNPAQGYPSHMTHSRSLDQYNGEQRPSMQPMPSHRHSFDQPPQASSHQHHYQHQHHHQHQYQQMPGHVYETPYECDGTSVNSSVSYADVVAQHPYNVSGNRYPLPLNMSYQFNTDFVPDYDTYANVKKNTKYGGTRSGHHHHQQEQHQQQQPVVPPMPPTRQQSSVNAARDLAAMRSQHNYPPEHLIDFDDRAMLVSNEFPALGHYNSLDHQQHSARGHVQAAPPGCVAPGGILRGSQSLYAQPKDTLAYCNGGHRSDPDDGYDNCTYAKPTPRANRSKQTNTTDRILTNNTDNVQQDIPTTFDNRKSSQTNGIRRKLLTYTTEREASECSVESMYTDNATPVDSAGERAHKSPTQAVKNQDGVGSFESWDYVFNNLEQSGYSKDLGERGDLLVKSLDLGSLHKAPTQPAAAAKATDKRRPSETKATTRVATASVATNTEKAEPPPPSTITVNAVKKEKSILKQPPQQQQQPQQTLSASTGAIKKQQYVLKSRAAEIMTTVTPPTPTTTFSSQDNNNGNVSTTNGVDGRNGVTRGKSKTTATATPKTTPASTSGSLKAKEWGCVHCTYLNPHTARICEMCSRTHLAETRAVPPASNHKPTCV